MLTRSLTMFVSLRSLLIQYKLITSFLIRKESKEMIYASLMLGLILYNNNTNYFLLKRKISKKLTYNKHITLASLGIIMITNINTLARSLRSLRLIFFIHTLLPRFARLIFNALDNATLK